MTVTMLQDFPVAKTANHDAAPSFPRRQTVSIQPRGAVLNDLPDAVAKGLVRDDLAVMGAVAEEKLPAARVETAEKAETPKKQYK